MMQVSDVMDLLALASTFDNRKADEGTAASWHRLIGNESYAECVEAILAHQVGPLRREYLVVGHITDAIAANRRSSASQVEADVRSAKARGIIDRSWHSQRPLPADAAAALKATRDRENQERAALDARDALPGPGAIEAGVKLKQAPRA